MIDRIKNPFGYYFKKNEGSYLQSRLFNLPDFNNIENDPNFVVYDTSDYLPVSENSKHFSSLASILSVENGYFGTRSCLEECYCDISTGATYIAGIYMVNDDLITDKLAVMPDWTRIKLFIEDEPMDLTVQEIIKQKRYFDTKRAVSVREVKVKDADGRITRLKTEKFASLKDKHFGGQSISIIPENYSAQISIRVGIDGNVVNVDYADFERKVHPDAITFSVNLPEKVFKDGDINFTRKVSMTRKNFIRLEGQADILPQRYTGRDDEYVFEEYEIQAERAKEIRLNSLVSINTSLDSNNPTEESYKKLQDAQLSFYEKILKDHEKTMERRLEESGICIAGDRVARRYANYSIARLIMAGENNGEMSSITARTLTGPSYAGHVFWDNEIFDMPFFTYVNPEAARTMLMYRYNTLEGARKNRRLENEKYSTEYKGARFAWESTFSGLERTPLFVTNNKGEKVRIFTGTNEKHITPDVAYATYKYWLATGDDEFLYKYGAEIIFETARYSGSILEEGDDGKLHTKNVIGPDEYHEEVEINPVNGLKEGVNDNIYTNLMIQHNLEIALKTAEYLEKKFSRDFKKLKEKLFLEDKEIKSWIDIKERIYINQDKETGVFEQFKGFHNLKEFDLDYLRNKYGQVKAQKFDQVLHLESCNNKEIDPDKNNYKILKQPDVIMLMALFPEKYSEEVQKANYKEYEPRTSHGSSLSAGIHSLMAARLGLMEDAYKYYLDTGGMDIDNIMGNAANGIHAASLGATWQAIVMGFGGMETGENHLTFNPNLPEIWKQLGFKVKWHGQVVKVVTRRKPWKEEIMLVNIFGEKNKPVPVKVGRNEIKDLVPGIAYSAIKTAEGWKWAMEKEQKGSVITGLFKTLIDRFRIIIPEEKGS